MTPLENPIDFAFDAEGAIVLVAYHDPRILRVGAAGVVEVLAGTGDLGDDGDGGPALSAHFTQLAGMAIAVDGRIAVSDDKTHRVRVFFGTTVEAVAGESGNAGFVGDGGLAMNARLSSPRGLAFDVMGNLYVADTGNHRVRRVGVDGVIETVAGVGTAGDDGDEGPATDAQLRSPEGVFVATDGSLYIADTGNHRIRRVDATGTISTFAGSTRGSSGDGGPLLAAQLQNPSRVDVSDEAVLIADQRNHLVRTTALR